MSHSARGAWIETIKKEQESIFYMSHSARGAWIETPQRQHLLCLMQVALREGCVDRNLAKGVKTGVMPGRTPRGVRG